MVKTRKARNVVKKLLRRLIRLPIRGNNREIDIAWGEVSSFLFSRYLWVFYLIIVSTVAAVFEGATMGLLGLAISIFVEGSVPLFSSLPDDLASSLNDLLFSADRDIIFLILVGLAVFAQILKSGLLYLSEWIQISLAYGMRIYLQQRITKHIMDMSYSDVSGFPAGRLATLIDQSKLVLDITVQLGNIVRATLMGVAYLVVMLLMSVYLTFAIMLAILVLWVLLRVIVRRVRSLSKDATAGEIALWRWTVEYLNAPRLLRIFNGTERATRDINKVWLQYLNPERKADLISAAIPKILEIVTVSGAGIFLVGALLTTSENRESVVSTLFVYVLIFFRLRPVIKSFNDLRIKIARIIPRLEVVGAVLDVNSEPSHEAGVIEFHTHRKEIRFENVSFQHPGSEKYALRDISFSIPKGYTVALVGVSGAGKSTIVDLLLALYRPTVGTIFIDGIDLTQLDVRQWRQCIGVVDQENFLLNTSVTENIRFGRPEASIQDITKAAKIANADFFIDELENGYETVIGDRGLRLSGGQQQRLALARAVISLPDILIMDEATSALDSVSERLIQESIEEMHHERTIIVIAHRLSTVANADYIVVLDRGRIVEQGNKRALLQNNGKFAQLWRLQNDQGV